MTDAFCILGDSWAWKGYTPDNFDVRDTLSTDRCLADYWHWSYSRVLTPGQGNLDLLDKIVASNISPKLPIVWIYTEPGRDYGRITGYSEFGWMQSEQIFSIRQELDKEILRQIKQALPVTPIAFVGGLSDVNAELVEYYGYSVLHCSWQHWIAEQMQSSWFQFGWGASDIGWRANYNGVIPSKAATFAWDEQIKEWCWWQDHGWFCHEHPSPMANEKFAQHLQPALQNWLETCQIKASS